MKKTLIYSSFIFISIMLITACSQNNQQPNKTINTVIKQDFSDGTLTYTNLISENIQNNVEEILLSAEISKKRTEKVFEWIKDFNQCMSGCESYELVDEFTKVDVPVIDYGDYGPMSKMWYKMNNRDYSDILCRIAAFQLLQDNITIENFIENEQWECYLDTQWLYSDWDAINRHPLIHFSDNEQSKYFSLYNPITIQQDCSSEEMYARICEDWTQRGIAFAESKASLITIWIQSGNQTVAAHAGVLIEDNGKFLFFEKTNPQSPYQASKFSSIEQMKQYMYESIHIENVRYGNETGTYIVMRNEKMI